MTNLELTAAYAAIANQGEYNEPSFYTQVLDHDGNVLLDKTQTKEQHQVIKEDTAWLLTDAMKDVMTSGTGMRLFRNRNGTGRKIRYDNAEQGCTVCRIYALLHLRGMGRI